MSPRVFFILISTVALLQATVGFAESTPLTIEDCIQKALTQNHDILIAKAAIEQRDGMQVEARASFLPSLDLSSNYTRSDRELVPSFNGERFGSYRDWNFMVTLSQSIYSGGQGTANYKEKKRLHEAAEQDLEETINSVLLEVYKRFYGVLLADAQVQVQEENIKLLDETLRIEKDKFQAGSVSQFNVLRAEVALANNKVPLIRSRNEARLAREELVKVLSMQIDGSAESTSGIQVQGSLAFDPSPIELQTALEEAQKRRPLLKSLEKSAEAAKEKVTFSRGDYLPSLSVEGGYKVQKSPFTNDLHDEINGWTVGARARWNLFDGFATTGKVSAAQAQELSQTIALSKGRLEVTVEVRRAYSSLREAQELVAASRKVAEQAEESLRLARERFSAGASPQIEVLDSQVALTQARTNEIQALYDFNIARSSLNRAIGARFDG